ncbi:MAG: hypothetical protein HEP71_09395 [Roseivirga sp.]|nr:hypothetical protein [Roseivirga sp.]
MMDQDELTPEEQAAFEELAAVKHPPSVLEDRIVAELKKEGLIKKTRTMNNYIKYAAGLAASVIIFFAGNFVGRQSGDTVEIDPLKGYIMILKEDASFQPGDPMQMFEEYASWMNGLYSKGVKITGQELKNEALEVTAATTTELDGDDGRRTTGYFVIETKTKEEALAVVKDNPHLKYGGIIELKAFMNR